MTAIAINPSDRLAVLDARRAIAWLAAQGYTVHLADGSRRLVAEALASEASPDQLERLRQSITDDDVLALFESERGELTATEPDIDTDEISGGESARFVGGQLAIGIEQRVGIGGHAR